MKARLSLAPKEFTAAARTRPLVLSLPSPSNGFERFAVLESPVVAPALGARDPFIKTYSGQGIDDPAATVRLDLGLTGFHAQVLSPHGDWYIDPYYHLEQSVYVSYFARDLANVHGRFVEHSVIGTLPMSKGTAHWVVGSELRTYRLALAADGEYSQFNGGTVPLVHNELVVLVNRITGVYERELGVRLQLIANNDSLIYLNPATDPYTNTNPSALLGQNQANIDTVIGNANYDVGHVLTTGGGGLSGVAVVGKTGQKAESETGLSAPTGDAFYIDYVAHEMGHEFGGSHSFAGTQGSCAGNGLSSRAVEPGSGTTIMAYAGICANDDLQPHSDDYFSWTSFDEMAAYTTTPGSAGNLGVAPSGNTPPNVTVNPPGAVTIPIRTPFALSATGTDVNGDTLTYDWEGSDAGRLAALNAPTKPSGALFRSFSPTTNPTRVFPKMSSILANTTDANSGTCPAVPAGLACWSEFLPTAARTMGFRVTIRDNNVASGGVNSADVTVTAAGTAPFLVTSPNTAVTLPGGSVQTVTWNVAGTNAAPFSTPSVNILLSTDGGASFATTLASGTPNDGTQSVTLPNVSTSQARIEVQAVANIFFDVSDANFTITGGGGNVPPVANDDTADTDANTAVPIAVLSNDTDVDGTVDPTTVAVVGNPSKGGTSVNPTTGVITYTPTFGFVGADAFTYTVKDDDGATSNVATVHVNVGGGGGSVLFPSAVTAESGTIASGSAASLGADDDVYLVVNSPTQKGTKVATWHGSFTGVDNAVASLAATYRGKASLTCTQVISIWRWTDSTWVQLDSRSIGATEVEVAGLSPTGTLADFVSGTSGPGEVRVRVSCSHPTTAFALSGDLMEITT